MPGFLNKNNSFYIAGHNGMVGNSILKALKHRGYGNEENGGKLYTTSRQELDLSKYEEVMRWFNINKPEIVIIAAAKVGGIYANYTLPYDFISENLKVTHNLIEAAWKNGAKRLLFLGSSCIYPKFSNIPIKEEELLSSYLEKTNEPYAIAKIAGIKLCEAIRKQYNFDAISLMPTNLYGPGDNYCSQNSHVMAALIKKFILAKRNKSEKIICWGTGNPLREFLHVDDLGNACISALEKWNPDDDNAPKDNKGEKLCYLNVGSGEEISIKDLTVKISHLTDFQGSIFWDHEKPDGTFRKVLDNSKLKFTGWEPKIKLDDGIKQVIKNIEYALNDKSDRGKSLRNFLK